MTERDVELLAESASVRLARHVTFLVEGGDVMDLVEEERRYEAATARRHERRAHRGRRRRHLVELVGDLAKKLAREASARAQGDTPRGVVRLDDLTPAQRRLILALVDAARSVRPADEGSGA